MSVQISNGRIVSLAYNFRSDVALQNRIGVIQKRIDRMRRVSIDANPAIRGRAWSNLVPVLGDRTAANTFPLQWHFFYHARKYENAALPSIPRSPLMVFGG